MQYTINVNPVRDDANGLKARVSVVLGDKDFMIHNIQLRESNGKLFVSFPSRQVYKDGQPVMKDGKPEYQNFIFPATKEMYSELTEAIKNQYANHTTGQMYRVGEPMRYTVNVRPYQNTADESPFRGFASLSFDNNAFVVKDIRLYENPEHEIFASMPNYQKNDQYVDIAHPASKAFKDALDNTIKEQYSQKLSLTKSFPLQTEQQTQTENDIKSVNSIQESELDSGVEEDMDLEL